MAKLPDIAGQLVTDSNALWRRMRDQEAELRELLAYLESRNPKDDDGVSELGYYESQYEGPAYGDAASRLRAILDGE